MTQSDTGKVDREHVYKKGKPFGDPEGLYEKSSGYKACKDPEGWTRDLEGGEKMSLVH